MQIATILSLAASVTCVGLFTKQKNWVLAAAFAFSTVYTILDKAIHIAAVPAFVIPWCAYAFFALVAYEIFRKVVLS
ncbi:MAG TPA: hypothetical protein VN089_05650 [Duganella sp.]|nr:hypothetical protein [Duganella sp.]